jgi:hypothetical protein
MAEHMKQQDFHAKTWMEWFQCVWEELTRQNIVCHESQRLGILQQPPPVDLEQLASGYYPTLPLHDPHIVEVTATLDTNSADHNDDDCSIATSIDDIEYDDDYQTDQSESSEHTELVWKFSECYGCGRNNHASSECQLLNNFNQHPDVNTNPDIRWIDSESGTAWQCIDDTVTVCPRHKTLSGHYFKPSRKLNLDHSADDIIVKDAEKRLRSSKRKFY